MYPADLNPNPDPLWPLCLGTSGLLLCWWGHCPCLPCCDSASCFLSLSKQPLLAPNKGPTQLTLPISPVGRDCFPSTSMERIFSENICRLYKPLMSEMLNIRATKFSHSLVLSTLLSSPTGTYRQACFHVVDLCLVLCEFFIPFGTGMSFLCPSSTLLPLCPDRAWTHHSWSCSCPVCRPQHICRRTGKLWGSCCETWRPST